MSERNPRVMSETELRDVMGEGIMASLDPGLRRAFEFADSTVPAELRNPEHLKMQPGKLKVSGDGIFYTLQGEGVTMGEPTEFLRLQICNLACGWCDAYYTWNPKVPEFWTEAKDIPTETVADIVQDRWGAQDDRIQRRLVITGGEPLLQKEEIDNLIDLLPQYAIEIETNGTIMPTEKQLAQVQFNCSPKLRNSANRKTARQKPRVIEALQGANTMFKFVVMSTADLDEIEKEWVDGMQIHPERVILMPQGVTSEEVQANMQKVAEYAKVKGYRLLGRLQNDIWGARRGV